MLQILFSEKKEHFYIVAIPQKKKVITPYFEMRFTKYLYKILFY